MIDYKHRVGRFFLLHHEVQRSGLDLLPLFGRFVVVDCRFDYSRNGYVYMALSPLFDEVNMGDPAPEYELILTRTQGKITCVEARKTGC